MKVILNGVSFPALFTPPMMLFSIILSKTCRSKVLNPPMEDYG